MGPSCFLSFIPVTYLTLPNSSFWALLLMRKADKPALNFPFKAWKLGSKPVHTWILSRILFPILTTYFIFPRLLGLVRLFEGVSRAAFLNRRALLYICSCTLVLATFLPLAVPLNLEFRESRSTTAAGFYLIFLGFGTIFSIAGNFCSFIISWPLRMAARFYLNILFFKCFCCFYRRILAICIFYSNFNFCISMCF